MRSLPVTDAPIENCIQPKCVKLSLPTNLNPTKFAEESMVKAFDEPPAIHDAEGIMFEILKPSPTFEGPADIGAKFRRTKLYPPGETKLSVCVPPTLMSHPGAPEAVVELTPVEMLM